MTQRIVFKLCAAALACAAFACSDDGTEPTPAPQSLDQIQIPKTFTFQTNKPVDLTISATAEAAPKGAALEVRRADGRVVYMGPLQPDQPLELDVVVPSKDSRVDVKLMGRNGERTAQVDVSSGQGTARFE